jgi:hypothetical protein
MLLPPVNNALDVYFFEDSQQRRSRFQNFEADVLKDVACVALQILQNILI